MIAPCFRISIGGVMQLKHQVSSCTSFTKLSSTLCPALVRIVNAVSSPPKWVEIVAMRLVFIHSQEVLKHLVGEVELLIDILFKDILDSQLQWEWFRKLIVGIISEY